MAGKFFLFISRARVGMWNADLENVFGGGERNFFVEFFFFKRQHFFSKYFVEISALEFFLRTRLRNFLVRIFSIRNFISEIFCVIIRSKDLCLGYSAALEFFSEDFFENFWLQKFFWGI